MANQRNSVTVSDSGVVSVVSVGTQGPAGSDSLMTKAVIAATAQANMILQFNSSNDQWEGVTTLDGLTIDAGTY